MPALIDLLLEGRQVGNDGPGRRTIVSAELWEFTVAQLADGHWTLFGLWAEPDTVHMALFDEADRTTGIISLDCPDGSFPSVGQRHPPAIRPERAIRDLFGLTPEGLPDDRPWLDHGKWGVRHPLGKSQPPAEKSDYAFLGAEGPSLNQIAVGPVHAGIIEPGHFRFTANGEIVVRLEERLGYTHKGTEALMTGADLPRAARLAGRVSGDSTVAYAFAFARAAEQALGIDVPRRAIWLRALAAELERLANHLGDIGAVCNDAAFPLMHAHCGALRERVLRAADGAFGHRLMRDVIVPGGVAADPDQAGLAGIRDLVPEIERQFKKIVEAYDRTPSIQDRTVSSGILVSPLARQYGAGGFIGRASGCNFDTRRAIPYAPYDELDFEVPVLPDGDVNARVWVRIREVEHSLSLVTQILDRLPDGPVATETAFPAKSGEGLAVVEGFRGDILVWLRLDDDGNVARCHLRDPSWFQWPLLEAVIEGNIVADFPLCNKSFNCSYSGTDL